MKINELHADFKAVEDLTEVDGFSVREDDDFSSVDFSRDLDNPVSFKDDPAFRITDRSFKDVSFYSDILKQIDKREEAKFQEGDIPDWMAQATAKKQQQ